MSESEQGTLTHFDESGRARMVEVGEKAVTKREAVASGSVQMRQETLDLIRQGRAAKGDVLAVAQVGGIMAAKRTWEIIPLCHPLPLSGIKLDFELENSTKEHPAAVHITARVTTPSQTGVEMEALTAVSAAALTVYDMCKAVDRGMTITDIRLEYKSGGRSGTYVRDQDQEDRAG
jgi:cyclic pyranopterin phosphate synthase